MRSFHFCIVLEHSQYRSNRLSPYVFEACIVQEDCAEGKGWRENSGIVSPEFPAYIVDAPRTTIRPCYTFMAFEGMNIATLTEADLQQLIGQQESRSSTSSRLPTAPPMRTGKSFLATSPPLPIPSAVTSLLVSRKTQVWLRLSLALRVMLIRKNSAWSRLSAPACSPVSLTYMSIVSLLPAEGLLSLLQSPKAGYPRIV